MITVNQVYKDLIGFIKTALASQGLSWQVLQAYQQTMGGHEPPYVLVHRLTSTNYGWQYGQDKAVTVAGITTYKHTENQIEKQTYQIDFIYKRQDNETYQTITGADVARLVSRWLMSETGIATVKAKGYEMLRISQVFEEYYKEVNEIYQVAPHFQLELIVKQTDEEQAKLVQQIAGAVHEVEQLRNLEGGINGNNN